jgi:lipopolysaccharide transport system ATP-binding protein
MTEERLPTSSAEVLVRVEGVGKKFCRDLKRSLWYGMKDIAAELLPGRRDLERHATLRPSEFWAVDDVSFELRRGECLGLIGRNGAGKTTLLKMLNGLIKPDKGKIEIRGRVGALIALGAGFNPILTGRENIYVNASVLGFGRQEIDDRLQEIIEFAELGDFIDTPVQSYSSGMAVRLGFSVAIHTEPDVLLLDEVLAVGDAAFRDKCYRRVNKLRKRAAIIFVSHNMEQIARISSRSLVLAKGQASFYGDVSGAVKTYEQDNLSAGNVPSDEQFISIQKPISDFEARCSSYELKHGESLQIFLTLKSSEKCGALTCRVWFYSIDGSYAGELYLPAQDVFLEKLYEPVYLEISIPNLALRRGHYSLTFHLIDSSGDIVVWSHKQTIIHVSGEDIGAVSHYQMIGHYSRTPKHGI